MDIFVSQGCKLLGEAMIVICSEGNWIMELGGCNVMKVVQDMFEVMLEHQRKNFQGGFMVGQVINEHQENFGRDDYVMCLVVGIDFCNRCLLMSDFICFGWIIRMYVYDVEMVHKDFVLLFDVYQVCEQVSAGLVFICNGRGN